MRIGGSASRLLVIVKDEPLEATFVGRLLRDAGLGVDPSWVRLAEAVNAVQDRNVGSVLLDLGPADAGGLGTLEAILRAQPGMPVVVLTGPDDSELGMRAVSAGAQDYLVKGRVTGELLVRSLRYAAERAEAAYARARLAAIDESSEDAMFSSSLGGTIRSWNRAAERLYGYEAAEIVGRNVSLLEPRDRCGEMDRIRVRILAGERLLQFATRRMGKDGSEADVSLQISPLIHGGRIIGVSTIARDVSANMQSEAALRESGDRLAEAQRLAHIGSWSLDVATGRQSWSDELYRLLDCEPGDFDPDLEQIFDRLHPADAVRVRAAFLAQVSRLEAWEDEFRIMLPGGGVRWVAARTEPVPGKDGEVVGVHGTSQDITGRRRAEERLRFQAQLLDAVGEAIIATDLDGAIVYWGPGAERLYGWSAEEVQSRSIVEVIPVVAEGHDRAETRSRLTRGEPWAGMMQRGRRDGSTFVAEVSTTPVFDDTGRLVGNISVCSDVSAREEAKRTLERARDEALEASLLKSNFLATMSHEIRTPMNGVLGMTDLLLDTPLDDRQRDYAESVRASGDDLLTILNDILDLSKIEAGRLDLESIDFDVTAVIEDVAELFAGQAQAKGLKVLVSIADDVPATVRGDPGRVRQVLSNLLSNAVKFTSTGLVTVSARAETPAGKGTTTLLVQVEDTGIGIDADTTARIFEPFAQADSSTTRRYGGTGLGLAITRQLVELMGGRCGVNSEVSVGSTFWFTLALPVPEDGATWRRPASEGSLGGVRSESLRRGLTDLDVASPARTTAPSPGVHRTPRPILLAEDNVTNQRVTAAMLQSAGYSVDVVANGIEAVAAVKARAYDLVLMDCHMPQMDGLEAAGVIRADEGDGRRVPIIALTASAMLEDKVGCLAVGMDDHLAKPVKKADLLDAVARWAAAPPLLPGPELLDTRRASTHGPLDRILDI